MRPIKHIMGHKLMRGPIHPNGKANLRNPGGMLPLKIWKLYVAKNAMRFHAFWVVNCYEK